MKPFCLSLGYSEWDTSSVCCEQLKKVDLLIDDLDGKPYKYGTAWLTNEIPSFAKEQINKLLEVA